MFAMITARQERRETETESTLCHHDIYAPLLDLSLGLALAWLGLGLALQGQCREHADSRAHCIPCMPRCTSPLPRLSHCHWIYLVLIVEQQLTRKLSKPQSEIDQAKSKIPLFSIFKDMRTLVRIAPFFVLFRTLMRIQ